MRINKYLALCAVDSRRKCEQYVLDKRVKVNSKVVDSLAFDVNEKKDKVELDGKVLQLPKAYVYYKLNKPKGYICTKNDPEKRKTVYDIVNSNARLFSIGRLDYNTEGLIILTNDGDLAERVSHPSKEKEKEYIVKIKGDIKESELAVLRAGVVENGERLPKCKAEVVSVVKGNTRISVTISQGLNRQIRRMFECINKDILMLKRVRIGSIKLGGLKRGEYKELNQYELYALLEG